MSLGLNKYIINRMNQFSSVVIV